MTYCHLLEPLNNLMPSSLMMKHFLWILMLSSVILIGTTVGITNAQSENTSQNNMGNGTTGSVINLTNASSSPEDAKNMSVIEGTVNQTG